jgi:hypothetical protein
VPTKKEKQPLSVTHPELAKEADGWDPSQVTYGSGIKRLWKCKYGHNWTNSPNSRIGKSIRGCPICTNQLIQVGVNDLFSTHPNICNEIEVGDPKTVTSGSKTKFLWKCPNNHRYRASIYNHVIKGTGCPKCLNRLEQKRYNSLSDAFPIIASEAFGWDPKIVSGGSGSLRKWLCSIGHIYEMKIDKRTLRGQSCPFCSGHKVLAGFNDLATTHKHLLPEIDGWDPTKYSKGSEFKANWKCKEGHIWRAFIVNRTLHNQGCPTCSITGFDPNADGYLYFIVNSKWGMLQVGITNDPDKRLRQHRKLGWELLELRGPMDGHLTQQWETAILRMLKARGADLSNAKIAGKFDGYSEAWSKSTFEVNSIKELMRLTEEFEEK